MKNVSSYLRIVLLFALLTAVFTIKQYSLDAAKPMIFTKCPACPEDNGNYGFALLDGKDHLVTFSNLIEENNIIVAFWASYCVPCKKEIPQLIRLEKKYAKEKNIRLVLINVDKEGKSRGLPVLKDLGVSALCLFDIYQVTLKRYVPDLKIPAVFLINRDGQVVFRATGEGNIKRLEEEIRQMR